MNKTVYLKRVGQLLAMGFTLASAQAQAAIDTTAVTTAITDAGAAVAVVGAAVLVLTVGIAVYKWLKRPLN